MKLRFWMVSLFAAAFVLSTVNITGCGLYRRLTSVSGEETVIVAMDAYYHQKTCYRIGGDNQAFFLSDALQLNYKPCPTCRPTCRPPRLKEGQDSGNAEIEFSR